MSSILEMLMFEKPLQSLEKLVMARRQSRLGRWAPVALAALAALASAAPVQAAALRQVDDFNGSGLPPDVTMSIYVPDKPAATPPVLVLIHYCGGTASAVFGQARGGGIVSAADQYGFLIVVPSSGRCWDVVSDKSRTRDGGGDSHAIRQMVQHAVDAYGGNAERVYATGDSSGAMMTELLLALYPDVFKAGSAFAGMPAGCRAANESGDGGGYSGACGGGSVSHTPQQWGDIARSLDPGYTGRRPRVQLFHGDADTTIRYPNFTEAIKQWTDVLGLSPTPTTVANGLSLGNHQATRQTWQNTCGRTMLDAFTSLGGDHGPSDALFVAQYVVPFLHLDVAGAVDPETGTCDAVEPEGRDAGVPGAGEPGEVPMLIGGANGNGMVDAPGSSAPSGAPVASDTSGSGTAAPIGESAPQGPMAPSAAASAPIATSDSNGCTVSGARSSNGAGLGAVAATFLALMQRSRRRKSRR
jgi:acetylxylan esterase